MLNFDDLVTEYNTPKGLIKMIDALDIITLNHSVRTCEISRMIEHELGYNDKKLSEAALYHDIGKYFISTKLLNKRGRLNKIERTIIDAHAYLSYKIIRFFDIDSDIALIALFHHKFNPTIFFGEDVDEIETISTDVAARARAIKTIDIFEALTTDRPYHRGITTEEAIKTIMDTVPDCDMDVIRAIRNHSNELE